MEFIYWNLEKNERLKKERGICFEDIVLRINEGDVLEITDHPDQEKYPGQLLMIVNVEGYAYVVPFILEEKRIFLKTIIPTRKYTKKLLKGRHTMKTILDQEEKEILAALESRELRPIRNTSEMLSRLRTAARNTIKKDKRVNIRISSKDLVELQVKAVEEGVPYQTLMSSVLHKYVNGRLREKATA